MSPARRCRSWSALRARLARRLRSVLGLAIAVAFTFALLLPAARGQTVVYTPTFSATNVSMWGPGASQTLNYSTFVGAQWNSSSTIGGIERTVIGDFGATATASSSGKIGYDIEVKANNGGVDVNLPYRISITPSASSLTPAGAYSLNIAAALNLPSGQSAVVTRFPGAEVDVKYTFQLRADLSGEVAFFDSARGSVNLINANATIPIINYNENNNGRVTLFDTPALSKDLSTGLTIPITTDTATLSGGQAGLAVRVGTVTLNPPALNASSSGQGLTTSASQPTMLAIQADPLGVASVALGLPANPLDLRGSFAGLDFNASLIAMTLGTSLGLGQNITVVPGLTVTLRSDVDLTYYGPGYSITTNRFTVPDLSQPVRFIKPEGNIGIYPEFSIDPSLRNQLSVLLSYVGSISVLQASVSKLGVSLGSVGPLYSDSFTLPLFDYNVYDRTFDISGNGSLSDTIIGQSLTPTVPANVAVGPRERRTLAGNSGTFTTQPIEGTLRVTGGALYSNTNALSVLAGGSLILDAGSGLTANSLTTVGLANAGTVSVGSGSTLRINSPGTFANLSVGTLTGGTYVIGGLFSYPGTGVVSNAANLTVNPGGSFQYRDVFTGVGNALSTLSSNQAAGTLNLGVPLTLGAFTNAGTLVLRDTLTVPSFTNSGTLDLSNSFGLLRLTGANGFANVNASGVLSGGTYILGGSIQYEGANDTAGRTIVTNAANLTLTGSNSDPRLSHWQPDGAPVRDALATLSRNDGTFILSGGVNQSLGQSFTNNGTLTVTGNNTLLSVAGNVVNLAGKTLTIADSATLAVADPASDRTFTNSGTLTLSGNGRLEVDGSLGNFSNVNLDSRTGTLTGGVWNIGGMIAYGTGEVGASNISEIGAGTVINMLGGELYNQFRNESALTYLTNNRGTLLLEGYTLRSLFSLTNSGTITVTRNSGVLGFRTSLANTGTLDIGAGATLTNFNNNTFDSDPNYSNLSSGTLSGLGRLILAGNFNFKAASDITGLAAGSDLTLSGAQWKIRRFTGSGVSADALKLTNIAGAFRLIQGATYTTPAASVLTVASTGTIAVGADSKLTVASGQLRANAGATFVNDGTILLQHSGTTPSTFNVAGNVTLSGTGSLVLSDLATNAVLAGGGTLTNAAGHVLGGAGQIQAPLVNRGTVQSLGAAGLVITSPAGTPLVNSGLIFANGDRTSADYVTFSFVAAPLTLRDLTVTNFEGATAGSLLAATRLTLQNATVNGGIVATANNGTLVLAGATLAGGTFENASGGTVQFADNTVNRLGGTSLLNRNSGQLTFLPGSVLEVTAGSTFANSGTVSLVPGARIEGAGTFANSGTVLAVVSGSGTPPILGAAFSNLAAGTVQVDRGQSLRWNAAVAPNAGSVIVGGSGEAGTLSFPGNTTLSGGGSVQIGGPFNQVVNGVTTPVWSTNSRLTAPDATAPVLTNADNIIFGAGTLGDTRLGVINQSAGTIHASASGATLTVNPGPAGFTNQGLLKVAAGARLDVDTTNGAFANFSSGNNTLTGGRYEIAGTFAFPGANVVVNAADLALLGSGRILNSTTNADALAGFATNAAGATFRVQSGAAFAPAGNFTNSGTVVIGGAGALAGGNVTFSAYNGAGALTLADPTARLAFTPASGNTVVSGVLSGDGQLAKSGAGTLVLTGNNSFTGPTTISAGTLSLGNGTGTTGLITGNIANSGALTFALLGAQTYPGVLSGNGTVAKTGSGNLTLTANNTLTGTVTVSGGNLIFGGSGNLAGNIVNTAGLRFERSSTQTYAGSISGNGTLTKSGTGVLVLAGNVAQANIVISSGSVQVGNGTSGSLAGNVSLTGLLAFSPTGNSSFVGNVTGSGSVNKVSTGNLSVVGSLGHTGGTTIYGGTLEIGAGGTAGSLAGNVANDGTLAFNRSDSLVYGGVVSGNGSLAQRGAGTTILTGTHTFTGGTTISAGTLQLGNGGAAGSVSGNIVNNANLAFSRSDAVVFDNVISGSGNVTKLGTSTLTFGANQTYTGTTTVSGGTLQIGNGGTAGSVAGPIANSGTVVVDRSDSLALPGAISGSGNLVKNGAGTLTLAAANSFSGTTVVNAGTLVLGDSLALQSSTVSLGAGTNLAFGTLTSATLGGLGGSANIILNNASAGAVALTAGANGASTAYSGNLSGNGTFTKTGNGTLTLTGNNVFGGTVTVAGGTLALGTAGSFSADPVVNSGATLRLDAVNALGARTFAVNGGTVVLNANQLTTRIDTTLTGGTISGPGTFELLAPLSRLNSAASAVSSVVSAPLSFGGSSTFGLNVADGAADLDLIVSGNLSVAGSRTFNKVGAGTLQLSGTNTLSSPFSIREGTLSLAGANAATGATLELRGGNLRADANITGAFTLNAVSAATVNTNAFTLTVGSLLGSGALVKEGTGTFLLTGDSTHSGSLTLSAGTFQLGNGGTTGSLAGNVVNNAGLTFNRSDAVVFGQVISGSGNVTKLGASSLTFTADQTYTGTTTISAGSLQLGNGGTAGLVAGNIANAGSLVVNRSDAVALAGVISGAGSLTKQGNNTLTLTGANTYTGGTTISAGTLQIGDGGLSGNLTGNIANAGTLAVNRIGGVTLAGVISGTGNLVKSGTGSLTLSGNNTFSGGLTLSGGTLVGAHNSAFGTGTVILTDAAVSFYVSGTASRTVANPITVAPGTASAIIGTSGSGGSSFTVLTGNLALGRPTTLFDSTGSRTSFDGVVSGNVGTLTIGGVTNGRVTLGNTNTFVGDVVVANGVTLQLNAGANVTQVLPLASAVDLSTSGRLWIANANSIGSLTGGTGAIVQVAAGGVPASALTVGANGASTEFAGTLRNGTNNSGAFAFTKIGAGTLTLSGNNTYSGATAINAGTLRVANSVGSAFGTSAVTVAAGATLAGAGSFTGPLTLSGLVSPGASPGTLATGSQTWNGGAAYVWEINRAAGVSGTNYDLLAISGSLTVAATSGNRFTLSLVSLQPDNTAGSVTDFNSAQTYSFPIVTTTTGITGFSPDAFTLNTSAFANSLGGGAWSLAVAGNNLNLNFTPSAIPEPSTYAALAGLAALALAFRRRSQLKKSSEAVNH